MSALRSAAAAFSRSATSAACVKAIAPSSASVARMLPSHVRSLVVMASARQTVISDTIAPYPVRNFGLLDKLKQGVKAGFTEKAEEKKREIFQAQLDFLASNDTYSMGDHLRLLQTLADKSGVNGWTSALRTKEQQAEIDEQFLDLKIGDALTPEEKSDISLIRRREKLRISSAIGCDVSRVNRFLDGYEQSKTVHGWIQSRKSRGIPLPKTFQEYIHCLSTDKVGLQQDKKSAMAAQLGNVRNTRAMLRKM